jgi:hypothetical protein
MSFVFRYVKPDCRVYRDEKSHMVMTMKKRFPLDRWWGVLVHGQDRHGYNKIKRPEEVFQADDFIFQPEEDGKGENALRRERVGGA